MNLEAIILREVSQMDKDKTHVISLTHRTFKKIQINM